LHWNYSIEALKIILPIGLSFHTFQSLSYVIEVYRGKQKAEHNFGIFALYVMFYPQLVAGPIERPQNLLHQFYEVHRFDYDRVMDGLKLMAWGLFKKVVIADRLAILVNQVYASPSEYGPLQLLIATYFFAFQIYCDFSGYSDIAIGSAQVMGFRLMDNFNRPYFSKYISEFWNRWHISLSSWFRDYLYIPLGGSRVKEARWILNILIVFLVSGLWHGAKWTFVVWGLLNGFYMVAAHITKKARDGIAMSIRMRYFPVIRKYMQILVTFHLVLIGWVFFRADSLRDAVYVLSHMFRVNDFKLADYYVGLGQSEFVIAICAIIFMLIVHIIQRHNKIRHMLMEKPLWVRLVFYTIMLLSLVLFGEYGHQEFIYFQF
jgi:D-alanyl-lipoteichoic acid acyltransferase DltB (MBOAT superfamily)